MATYKRYFSNKNFLTTFFISLIMLCASFILNFYAGSYANKIASNPVTDIVLSNTNTHDFDGTFVYGIILFFVFIAAVCVHDPKRIPFTIKSIALFVVIRSGFISLTHIGPSPSMLPITSTLLDKFSFGGDLFFSGHTGIPFLMALVFWENFYLRILFLASSVMFGVIVLLAHLHYSIDVFAAFFITHTIFHIAEYIFRKDRKLFFEGL